MESGLWTAVDEQVDEGRDVADGHGTVAVGIGRFWIDGDTLDDGGKLAPFGIITVGVYHCRMNRERRCRVAVKAV